MEGSEVIPVRSFQRGKQHQHSVLQFARHSHAKKPFYRPDKLARMRNAWCREWKANLYYTLSPVTVLRDRWGRSRVWLTRKTRCQETPFLNSFLQSIIKVRLFSSQLWSKNKALYPWRISSEKYTVYDVMNVHDELHDTEEYLFRLLRNS